ncbi:MAG: FHA domain-containing protein [Lysobacterales bacterium]
MNTMRLHFPHAQTKDALLAEGETSIGCDRSCTVIVKGDGVEPVHVIITSDVRGAILWVRSATALTHVNGRPVREKALLHVGDTVNLGGVGMNLLPDTDTSITAPPAPIEDTAAMTADDLETRYRALPPRALLRGVSGAYFGKVVPIPGRLVIGRGNDADLNLDEPEMSRRHAQIEVNAEGIYLRDLGSSNGTYVNGVQVRDAVLFAGDQIAFDRNRFLIEAPGTPTRAQGARPPAARVAASAVAALQANVGTDAPAETPAADSSQAAAKGSPWLPLLIGAGIAAVLALLLFGGSR